MNSEKIPNNESSESFSQGIQELSKMPPFDKNKAEENIKSAVVENNKLTIHSEYHDGTSAEDKQIRSGLLTHLRVEVGDNIDDIYSKLDYLAKQGKKTFAIFNGQRINNWTEDEGGKNILLENQKEREQKKREAFNSLDENFDITNVDKFNIVGVFADVKTASEVSFYEKKDSRNNSSQDIETILGGLGLTFEKNIESDDEYPEYNYIQYIIGRNQDSIRKTKELIKKSQQEGQIGEATIELGHMFGFPDTAIRYFVERGKRGSKDNRAKINSFGYVHDPLHYQEEFTQYEKPILDMLKKYCPESAKELMINMSVN